MPRIKWDHDVCQSHGQCQIAAPDLFHLVGDRDVRYPEHIAPEQLKDAWAAADACPMQAIQIQEED
jgi:ferredoxin